MERKANRLAELDQRKLVCVVIGTYMMVRTNTLVILLTKSK